ncbi:MAG: hypothetical protein JKX79_11690 [Labilibaculum sp.]|nr:hypothetical protein [Labilibaculum sp.]
MIGNIWETIKSMNNDTILSCFIAMLALIFTIYQGYLTRKHNRLSVKPILSFESKQSLNDNRYTCSVGNRGLGPALIDSISLYYKKELIGCLNDSEVWDKLEKKLNIDRIDLEGISYTGRFPIKIDEDKILVALYYSLNRDKEEQINKFSQIEFQINYKSVYMEKFKTSFQD